VSVAAVAASSSGVVASCSRAAVSGGTSSRSTGARSSTGASGSGSASALASEATGCVSEGAVAAAVRGRGSGSGATISGGDAGGGETAGASAPAATGQPTAAISVAAHRQRRAAPLGCRSAPPSTASAKGLPLMPTLLSLGHGYSARRLSQDLLAEGWRILATTRSRDKMEEIAATGAEPRLWPLEDPQGALAEATHVLSSAAPTEEGDPILAEMAQALARAAPDLAWVGYLSTTGVYGDRGGALIDETAERRASTRRGRARVAAEDAWLALHREAGLPTHVFRLAGIYGPGRGPFAKVRAGTARRIVKPGQVFSRIHVDDIAQTLRASMARPRPGRAYNVNDDEAAPPQDVLAEAARLAGAPIPREVAFDAAEMSEMARSFYAECKRTSNARLTAELGVRLRHPTYREGLRAILAAEGG